MKSKKRFSTNKLLEGIQSGDPEILSYIYKIYFPQMRTFVLRNNGSEEEAQDIFQNAVVTVYNLAKRGKLDLTVKFNTFLLAVGNRMWLRQLKRKGIINFVKIEDGSENDYHEEDYQIEEEVYETMESVEKNGFYHKAFSKLSRDCQILLRMFYDNVPIPKIAEYFGLKNPEQAKKKKYRCKENLINAIKNDSSFQEFQ